MSAPKELKITGRHSYQNRVSVSPGRPAQPRSKSEENNEDSLGNDETSQSEVFQGSPRFSRKIDYEIHEETESHDFSTTFEDPLTTSSNFKDTSTTDQETSTNFKNTSTLDKGSLKTSKNPTSSSKGFKNTSSTFKSTSTYRSSSPNYRDTSQTFKNTSSTYKISSTTSKITTKTSPKLSHGSKQTQKIEPEFIEGTERTSSVNSTNWLIPVAFIIAVAVAAYAVPKAFSSDQNLHPDQNLSSRRNCSFEDFKRKYQNPDNILWKSLRVQIEGILNRDPAVPSVFLFLYTNRKTEDLVWKIAKTASACFDPSLEPMKLDNDDFTSQASIDDYGVIIKKYKEQVGNGGALVVANLNEIPGKAARALHAICDTYSPIVDRVVIFMTLRVQNEVGNPIVVAESTLNEIWGDSIKRYELDPLITRVTEQVFYLPNES